MLEGFFYVQKKLPIILFSYIIPIRKDNKKMTRKHFKALATILSENNVSSRLKNNLINNGKDNIKDRAMTKALELAS